MSTIESAVRKKGQTLPAEKNDDEINERKDEKKRKGRLAQAVQRGHVWMGLGRHSSRRIACPGGGVLGE